MQHGKDSSITYRVYPRFTSSEAPRNVDYGTALSWAEAERKAYAAQRTEDADATNEDKSAAVALSGIVEAHKYRDDKIEFQDLITGVRGVRDNPEIKRKALLTEKNESVIENALRVAADRYHESASEFQPDLPPSRPFQASKAYPESDVR
jgi:hypothetical protein